MKLKVDSSALYRYTVLSENRLFTFDGYIVSNVPGLVEVSNQYLSPFCDVFCPQIVIKSDLFLK